MKMPSMKTGKAGGAKPHIRMRKLKPVAASAFPPSPMAFPPPVQAAADPGAAQAMPPAPGGMPPSAGPGDMNS